MVPDPVPIRCRLPEILHSIGKNQAWLSDKTGLTKQRINDYVHMRNGRIMSLPIAYLIAKTVRVRIEELYVWKWREE